MDDEAIEKDFAAFRPRTKVGQLRKHMPKIEQLLADGATARDILAILNIHGLEMSEPTFRTYLHQYRKKTESAKIANTAMGKGNAPRPISHSKEMPTGNSVPPAAPEVIPQKIADKETIPHSPGLKRPGEPETFDWDKLRDVKPEW